MNIFDSYGSPSAKIADGRLILSLPDAETPAVWIMELNDAAAAVLRLETDRQGFYVIKKHGGTGKGAAETIAVYRDRNAAGRALDKASKALTKAQGSRNNLNSRPIIVRPVSKTMRFLNILLVIWFVLYLAGIDRMILQSFYTMLVPDMSSIARLQQNMAAEEKTPPAPGMPQSADDYLKSITESEPAMF